MATWPESSPAPRYPLTVEPEFNTLISNYDGGGEQRRQKLMYPKYNVVIKYNAITWAEAKTLWEFYLARDGAYEAFYIYDLVLLVSHSFTHTDQYCGTGDGVTDVYDIPGRNTSSRAVYVDGGDETGNVSFLVGGGTSNSDRIDFNTAPPEGGIITADFTGYLRMRVRFEQDKLPRESFITNLYNYGIKLKGLSPA